MTTSYRITIDGVTYDVEVGDVSSSPVQVVVDGVEFEVEIPDTPPALSEPSTPHPTRSRPRVATTPSATCATVPPPLAATAMTWFERQCPEG